MKTKPLVSVIIASFNHQDYILEAVQSVLNQTYREIEVIIADDGSTDKSLQVISKIKDSRLKIIALKENRKYHPRNLGIQKSKGSLIAFQNSDDVWASDKLQKQVDFLEKNQKVGAVFTQVNLIDSSSKILIKSWANNLFQASNKSRVEWLRHFLTTGNCLCISSALLKKSLFQKIGMFNESLVQLSDLDLWTRIASVAELFILPEKLTSMRILKGKNYSAPTKLSLNRSNLELLQILTRYSQEPILSQIGNIIPGSFRSLVPSSVIRQGRLIQKCWQIGGPVHILFATQLASKLLENPDNRKTLINFFGMTFIRNYIYLKGTVSLRLATLSK